MRQNLTNIKEVNIEDVEHFYVVGSTTKEGLIEGRSNVKLDLKKVGGGEGGGSSEDSAFLKALFGQTPYIDLYDEDTSEPYTVPLSDALAYVEQHPDTELSGSLFYKDKEPKPKFIDYQAGSDGLSSSIYFVSMSATTAPIIMYKVPDNISPEGTWYVPIIGEIDLTGFTIPGGGGGPVVLTGVEIPDKDAIIIAFLYEGEPQNATLTKISSEVFRGQGFSIYKENDVWMWDIMSS